MKEMKRDCVQELMLSRYPSELSEKEIEVTADNEKPMIDPVIQKIMKNEQGRHLIYYFVKGIKD